MDTLQFSKITECCIREIETDLFLTNGKGIFFAPELYIAFKLGIAYTKNSRSIFGTDNVEWLRETNFKNGGPTDLAFKVQDSYHLIEIKIASRAEKYIADIEKLKRANKSYTKYFIALADSFHEKTDDRFVALENIFANNIREINNFSFSTKKHITQTYCVTKIYEIK